jgi:adenosylmethionine-8-amino-7-oxononanoate aminotransferase
VRGAIGVVELDRIDDLNALRSAFVARGAFIRPIASVIYLAPALTMDAEDVAFLTRTMGEVLRES